jgi:hypothetical protein
VDQLAGVVAVAPTGDSLATDGPDPLRRYADDCLDGVVLIARLEAATAAAKVRLVAGHTLATAALQDPESTPQWAAGQQMAVVAEVACVLTIGERAASALVGASHALSSTLPAVLDALQAGAVSWQNAQVLVDETTGLDAAGAATVEAHFVTPDASGREALDAGPGGVAGELPPARFRRKVRSWRERHHPESIEIRHAKGLAERRMEYSPDRDGMGWVSLYLPADQANAASNRTRALARGLQGPNEPRMLSQLMADLGAAGLLGSGSGSNPAEVAAPEAQVLVTVPVLALLGLTDEPAGLDGHGPIPASMAKKLVADGATSFYRVLVDPRDGAPLEIGRTSYRLTKAMRNWLRLRDGKCPFPGCSNSSLDNEADHLLAWHHGGTTGISNLGQPCPKHHRMRHTSRWKPIPATKDEPPGWISPAGRYYRSEHQDWEPPHWPEMSEPQGRPEIPDPQSWPNFDRLYPEPPIEEPLSGNLVDVEDIPADDDVWDEFYALQFVLPKDPSEDWEQSALIGAENQCWY